MTSRLIATLGLASLLVGPSYADDKPGTRAPATSAPSAKELVKQAIEAASKDDLARGIALAEQALKGSPDDREALFLLGVLSINQADEAKGKAEKVALFHKSSDAFARLRARYKEFSPQEAEFAAGARLGDARALALEGKPGPALAAVKGLLAEGFDRFEAIEAEPDFAPVLKLPEFAAEFRAGIVAGVDYAMARSKSFPFDFELKDTDEKPVALADYKGKVTVVDVWGTWCPPCRKEIPHFVDLLKEYRGRGLEVVGINCNEEGSPAEVRKTIKDFAKEQKIDYRCLLNDDKTESKIPGFQGYPTTLFLDRAGKVRLTLVGYTPKARLEAIVAKLLGEGPKS